MKKITCNSRFWQDFDASKESLKKEGSFAVGLVVGFQILILLLALLLKSRISMKQIAELWIGASGVFFVLLAVLNRRKIHTLGLRKDNLGKTGILLVCIIVILFVKQSAKEQMSLELIKDLIFRIGYSLLQFFLTEEIIYRGYLWTRMMAALGKHKGTIVCGVMWGTMHLVMPLCAGETITGMDFLNSMLSGLTGQYIFSFLYSYSGNIFLPTIIHAFPHFF